MEKNLMNRQRASQIIEFAFLNADGHIRSEELFDYDAKELTAALRMAVVALRQDKNIMNRAISYILFYSPEREEVDSITVVTDRDDYDFTGRDKDDLVEKLKENIEDLLYGVYSKDWFYHGFCDDTLIATFKEYDDAKVFADNTDKDVYIVKIFVEDGYDDTTD